MAVLVGAGFTLVLALALCIALLDLHRWSGHLDPARAPGWFWYFRGDPQVRRALGTGLGLAFGLAAIVGLGMARNLRPPLYGAARWAGEADLRRAGLRAHQGILLGRAGGRLLTFGGPEHVLLQAPTRSGKGVGVVIPNLLTWPDSVVVLDVKRENWTASAGFRARHGQQVLLFDPLDPQGRTARFNPLGHVDRTDSVAVMDELQKLGVMLFPTPDRADPFWAEAARTGFIGVGALIAETSEAPFSFGEIYRQLTQGDPRTRLPAELVRRAKAGRPIHPGCAAALADFCASSENTFASVRQTLTSRLNLWLNPRVCAATEVSDFDLRDLRDRRISLYLGVSPDNLARVAPLYNLLFQQLIDLNTREPPQGCRHPIQVLVVLDEFARLGHAGVLARSFSYVAGYGLRLLAVLQSPAQLRAEYGPDLAEEILANCGIEIAFAPKELKVAQDLSERLGAWTYPSRSSSRPALLSSGRRSLTESDQRRALMLPQELLQMPDDQLLVLRAGAPPVRGRKIAYWREQAFKARLWPAPVIAPHLSAAPARAVSPDEGVSPSGVASPRTKDDLTLELILPALSAAGFEPPPPEGATDAEVEAWVDRFIDAATVAPDLELDHV